MTDQHDNQKPDDELPNRGRRQFLKGAGIVGAGAAIADNLLPGATKETLAAEQNQNAAVSGATRINLQINDRQHTVAVEPRTTLLNALRNHVNANNADEALTGTKLVCDLGTCGACTVLMDDKPVYSCLVLAMDAVGKKITTVEGLGTPENLNPVQAAFVQHDATMCGFCTPGFVTTISAYLKKNPNPTLDEVREACKGNFCRCGTYPKVFEAALAAATQNRGVTRAALSNMAHESEVA